MLSVQYLVNCRKEDRVCHGITTQEPRPRPMKETLHSRHNSTVLPRLCASRKERLRNMHTHAVDSAINLLGNNKVLKERSPPIADEEQRLNRRQRCTLSQILTGHFHLLQDYNHRVFGEPSDICTDCEAWLQTTQPTSGGAVTADSSCCANCVEPPRPQQWGPDLPFFFLACGPAGWLALLLTKAG